MSVCRVLRSTPPAYLELECQENISQCVVSGKERHAKPGLGLADRVAPNAFEHEWLSGLREQ